MALSAESGIRHSTPAPLLLGDYMSWEWGSDRPRMHPWGGSCRVPSSWRRMPYLCPSDPWRRTSLLSNL
eukprot:scaffold230571_cov35-Tisochrysis_lutea.AAC.4